MELVCLNCTLPICDESSSECKYVQITRDKKREYRAAHYQANKARYQVQNAAYYRANIEKKKEYDRRRYLERRQLKGRKPKQPKERKQRVSRSPRAAYYRARYLANREAFIEAAKERYHRLKLLVNNNNAKPCG